MKKKMSFSTKLLIVIWTPILLGIFGFGGYCTVSAIKDWNNENAWKAIPHNHMAVSMSEDYVRERLKFPYDAKFCDYKECKIKYVEETHTYYIYGTVNSKNGFGAYIPTVYYTEIQQVSENRWVLNDIKLD